MKGANNLEDAVYLVVQHYQYANRPPQKTYKIVPTKNGLEKVLSALDSHIQWEKSRMSSRTTTEYEVFICHPQWVKDAQRSTC